MEYNTEVWRPVKGYEGLYEISNLGRVKSLFFHCGNIPKIMKPTKGKYGYLLITLVKNGTKKYHRVHRLVAESFIPNPEGYSCVNHKDENKANNFVWINDDGSVVPEKSNLEWCTVKYNCNYGTGIEKMKRQKEKPVLQYTLSGVLIGRFNSSKEAAKITGVDKGSLSENLRGRNKTCGGFKWRFAND